MTQGHLLRRIPPCCYCRIPRRRCAGCPALAQTQSALGPPVFTPEKRRLLGIASVISMSRQQETGRPDADHQWVVTRSSGKRTVWINGVAQNEKDRSPDVTVIPSARNPARCRCRVQSPATQARVERRSIATRGNDSSDRKRVHQAGSRNHSAQLAGP